LKHPNRLLYNKPGRATPSRRSRAGNSEGLSPLSKIFRSSSPSNAYLVLGFVLALDFLLWPARGLRSDSFASYFLKERRVASPEVSGGAQQPQGDQRPKIEEATPVEGLPAVVLDAGHGGQDPGAHSRDGVVERDLVFELEERVRTELVSTNKYRVVLTRSGDADPTFDERAAAANAARPIAFLSFHAGNLGKRIPRLMVYTYWSPSSRTPSTESDPPARATPRTGGPSEIFVPWMEVHERHLERSRQLADALQSEFGKIPGAITGKPVEAPARALRSVDAPAAAIEIGSVAPDVNSRSLTNPVLQQQIATAVVRALEAFAEGGP